MPRRLIWLLLAAAVAQSLYYYPQLPATVASHFDGEGNPNGWQSKAAFFAIYAFMLGTFALIYLGLGALLPRIPVRLFSLPQRDYWLAPERRAETIGYLTAWLSWFGAAGMAFTLALFQLVIEANLRRAPLPPVATWILMGGFGGYVLIAVTRLVLRFARK